MGLSELVQGFITAQDHKIKQAQAQASKQFEQSKMQLEQQRAHQEAVEAQEKVKQQKIQNELEQGYLGVANDQQKATADHQTKQDATAATNAAERKRLHDMNYEAKIFASQLASGTRKDIAKNQLTARLIGPGYSYSAAEAERLASHIEMLNQQGIEPHQITGYDEAGDPIYAPPKITPTAQEQGAPTGLPHLFDSIFKKPSGSAGQFLTQQNGMAGQMGLGDVLAQQSPAARAKADADKSKQELQNLQKKKIEDFLGSKDLRNDVLKKRAALSGTMQRWYDEQIKDKRFMTPLTAGEIIARTHELKAQTGKIDIQTQADKYKLSQEKESADALKGAKDFADVIVKMKGVGNLKAFRGLMKDSAVEASKAQKAADHYLNEAIKVDREIGNLQDKIDNPPVDPITKLPIVKDSPAWLQWQGEKTRILAPFKKELDDAHTEHWKNYWDAKGAVDTIHKVELDSGHTTVNDASGKPSNPLTNAAAGAAGAQAKKANTHVKAAEAVQHKAAEAVQHKAAAPKTTPKPVAPKPAKTRTYNSTTGKFE